MNDSDLSPEQLLEQLRDVELPTVAKTVAPGWWMLLAILIGLIFIVLHFRRRWVATRWQRQAKEEMQSIRQTASEKTCAHTLASCSQLARKIALVVDEREQIANLHGEQWLEKLDDICQRTEFTQGVGRLIADQTYQKQPNIPTDDLNSLFDSMDVLIKSASSYNPAQASQVTP